MIEVRLTDSAESEYRNAVKRYRRDSAAVAKRFKQAFYFGIDWIAEFPEAPPLCDDFHRYCILKKFPYGIVYELVDGIANVVAVTHFNQQPGYWLD